MHRVMQAPRASQGMDREARGLKGDPIGDRIGDPVGDPIGDPVGDR